MVRELLARGYGEQGEARAAAKARANRPTQSPLNKMHFSLSAGRRAQLFQGRPTCCIPSALDARAG